MSETRRKSNTDLETRLAALESSKNLITVIKDVKANNTEGGTFTNGAWQTRDLNTQEGDTSFASVGSNQITLQPGTYIIEGAVPAFSVDRHKAKLYNITDSLDTVIGTSEDCAASSLVANSSFIKGEFTITSAKTFELQHRGGVTKATNGFGVASNFSVDEVYSILKITKIGS